MAVQVVIAIVGFYLIQSFEKYTVPVAAVIVLVMSILAWTKVNIVVEPLDRARRRQAHGVHAAADGDRRRLGHHLAHVVVRLHALHQAGHLRQEGVLDGRASAIFIPTVWLGFLGASIASAGVSNDPADFVSAAFGALSIPVLFLVMHGPVATNILNLYSATLAALSLDVKAERWKVSSARVDRRHRRADLVHPVGELGRELRQVARVGRALDLGVGRRDLRRLLRASGAARSTCRRSTRRRSSRSTATSTGRR